MKEIFFHVGLGKTASTYLQNKVFNKLKGMEYIHPKRYKQANKIIENSLADKIFISREMDRQLEREVKKFAEKFPHTKAIMVLRSNESWIASQYRRFLKNGYPYTFKEYFDIEQDTGYWKIADALFYPKIEILEKYFTPKPLVLFYEDMRKDVFGFIDTIAEFTGSNYSKNDISLEPHHTSYEEKQLKVMLKLAPFIFTKDPQYKGSALNTWLRRRSRMWLCYIILYSALLVPSFLISKKPLIPKEELDKVKKYFEEDWARCKEYVERKK